MAIFSFLDQPREILLDKEQQGISKFNKYIILGGHSVHSFSSD